MTQEKSYLSRKREQCAAFKNWLLKKPLFFVVMHSLVVIIIASIDFFGVASTTSDLAENIYARFSTSSYSDKNRDQTIVIEYDYRFLFNAYRQGANSYIPQRSGEMKEQWPATYRSQAMVLRNLLCRSEGKKQDSPPKAVFIDILYHQNTKLFSDNQPNSGARYSDIFKTNPDFDPCDESIPTSQEMRFNMFDYARFIGHLSLATEIPIFIANINPPDNLGINKEGADYAKQYREYKEDFLYFKHQVESTNPAGENTFVEIGWQHNGVNRYPLETEVDNVMTTEPEIRPLAAYAMYRYLCQRGQIKGADPAKDCLGTKQPPTNCFSSDEKKLLTPMVVRWGLSLPKNDTFGNFFNYHVKAVLDTTLNRYDGTKYPLYTNAMSAADWHKDIPDESLLEELHKKVEGKVVFIGTSLGNDLITSPVFGKIGGVFLHAMAYENLLNYGADYYRSPGDISAGVYTCSTCGSNRFVTKEFAEGENNFLLFNANEVFEIFSILLFYSILQFILLKKADRLENGYRLCARESQSLCTANRKQIKKAYITIFLYALIGSIAYYTIAFLVYSSLGWTTFDFIGLGLVSMQVLVTYLLHGNSDLRPMRFYIITFLFLALIILLYV